MVFSSYGVLVYLTLNILAVKKLVIIRNIGGRSEKGIEDVLKSGTPRHQILFI